MKKCTLLGLWLGLGCGLSAASQTLVKDIVPGLSGSSPGAFAPVAGGLLFVAGNNVDPYGLIWKTDGTTAGTVQVSNAAVVSPFVRMGAWLYFTGTTAANGQELWKTDGTAAGTALVKDIWPGPSGSGLSSLVVLNNRLYFQANDNVAGIELWTSDGTAAGTRLVKDVRPGPYNSMSGSSDNPLVVAGNSLYFRAWDGLTGDELWKSDGTAAGTVLVKDLVPGVNGCYPIELTAHNGKVYFGADDQVLGIELYVSDGTVAGTRLVRDINPGPYNSNPSDMQGMGPNMYFKARTPASGRELWKSDGTAAGTVLVKDILPGTGDGAPAFLNSMQYITAFNGYVYFGGYDGGGFTRLYRSNGTAAGTTVFNPATASLLTPDYVTVANNTLYFCAYEPTRNPAVGSEPWKSDGTAAGTVFMGDISPGSNSSDAGGFTYYNGMVIFAATDYNNGRELWRSVATPTATKAAAGTPALALWPNPAQGRATVQLPAGLEARELTLTDALGRVLRRYPVPAQARQATLDLGGLPAGLYLLRGGAAQGRLVVE